MQTQALTNTRNRQQWAEIIGAEWRRAAESTVQTGLYLLAAKEELAYGEFGAMLSDDLNIRPNIASTIMRVASTFRNTENWKDLPQRFSALVEISAIPEADRADGISRGLITPDLTVKAARAIKNAYIKPEGEVIGGAQHMLPSASEARKIARETGRFVAAADGHIYSGATKEEGDAYRRKRDAAFRIIEAIETLSSAPSADALWAASERHWFVDFRPGAIDEARKWLVSFKSAMGVIDA